MQNSEDVLVVILSAALAVFLALGIVVLIKVIYILNHVNKIIAKAESIADKAEHVTEFFEKAAGPASIIKLVGNVVESFKKHNKKR